MQIALRRGMKEEDVNEWMLNALGADELIESFEFLSTEQYSRLWCKWSFGTKLLDSVILTFIWCIATLGNRLTPTPTASMKMIRGAWGRRLPSPKIFPLVQGLPATKKNMIIRVKSMIPEMPEKSDLALLLQQNSLGETNTSRTLWMNPTTKVCIPTPKEKEFQRTTEGLEALLLGSLSPSNQSRKWKPERDTWVANKKHIHMIRKI